MPLYEYECRQCKEHFERRQSVHDEPVADCPDCGGSVRRVMFPVGIIFKGSGFYVTDSRRPQPIGEDGDGKARGDDRDEGKAKAEDKAEGKTKTDDKADGKTKTDDKADGKAKADDKAESKAESKVESTSSNGKPAREPASSPKVEPAGSKS